MQLSYLNLNRHHSYACYIWKTLKSMLAFVPFIYFQKMVGHSCFFIQSIITIWYHTDSNHIELKRCQINISLLLVLFYCNSKYIVNRCSMPSQHTASNTTWCVRVNVYVPWHHHHHTYHRTNRHDKKQKLPCTISININRLCFFSIAGYCVWKFQFHIYFKKMLYILFYSFVLLLRVPSFSTSWFCCVSSPN